ncbi:DUF3592 domain-containing protein [Streptomyces sp. NPDC097619]|uniref:DUF3592 domain-containing protein n=1 Tax=Streptomyces sp. NPDC097619 TaxID=3157228 RepID=UPI00332F6B3A
MGWEEGLVLWCVVWGVAALIGYGMAWVGATSRQRTVWLAGRIEEVREPRHGGSQVGGVWVVVSYRDPDSGRRVTVTNDGERGEAITCAWPGRRIGVGYRRGRPHAYRFSTAPDPSGRGLGWPTFALFLVYAGLVALASVVWGPPWALIGCGGPGAVFAVGHLPATVRATKRRAERWAAADTVSGRIVAVLTDVTIDQNDGSTMTTVTPVVSFTTGAGQEVTAHCTRHVPDPAHAYGREVPVCYDREDPAVFTLDRAAEHRSQGLDVVFNLAVAVVLVAAAVTGLLML